MTAVFYGACTPFGNLFYIFLPEALSGGWFDFNLYIYFWE
jgi:hypothetical protein